MIELLRPRLLALLATLLAATSLLSMVQGTRWWVELAIVLTIGMIGDIIVSRFWRPAAGALAAVIVAALATNATFAGQWSLLKVIPTPASIEALSLLLGQGAEAVYQLQAPLPGTDGVRCLLVAGLAFAWWGVDVLAGATASPALAGVPMLAIVLPAASLSNDGLTWWSFAAAAGGYLLLLIGGDRRRAQDWGRLIGDKPRWTTGRAVESLIVVAVTVALALVVPIFLPGLQNRLVPPGQGRGPSGAIAVLNPILNLHDDLTSRTNDPILTYTTDSQTRQPIRVVSDDAFDGSTWHPSYGELDRDDRVQNGLPDPPGLSSTVSAPNASASFEISGLRQSWLPTPYPPQRVNIEGDWLFNPDTLNIVGDHVTTMPMMRYQVSYLDVQPTVAQLQAANGSDGITADPRWTQLPPALPGQIARTADAVAGSGSKYEQAMRLQTWLRSGGGFSYSEQAPPENGSGAIVDFLDRKRGYCVHFASTMAVMARTLGIPARVAVGFQPGERQADGSNLVRQRDAHAWPELYFAGVGWVYFEPTPAAQIPNLPAYALLSAPAQRPTSSATPSTSTSPSPSSSAPAPTPTPSATSSTSGPGVRPIVLPILLVVALLLVAALLPAAVALARRRRRWRQAADSRAVVEAGWGELIEQLTDLGLPVPAAMTVRQIASRLQADLPPEAAASLRWLADQVEAARYAPPQPDSQVSRARVRGEVATIIAAVAQRRGRSQLWRARLHPQTGSDALRRAREKALRR